jgi:peptidoglycan/LPS O-acetylase OafA/YrhL
MNTFFSRYATTLLPLAVGVLGILQASQAAGTGTVLDWQTLTQIGLLLLGTGVVFWLPLVDARWHGAAKTGSSIGFAILSALVAVIPDGHFTKANAILVITAVVKAVATELGVQIRTDAAKVIDARESTAVAVVTSLPASAMPGADALVVGDGLADPANTRLVDSDEPKHSAKS